MKKYYLEVTSDMGTTKLGPAMPIRDTEKSLSDIYKFGCWAEKDAKTGLLTAYPISRILYARVVEAEEV